MRVATAQGSHGRLSFVLQRIAGGLYVEREEVPKRGTQTFISIEFTDRDAFRRWLDEDPSRFDHPLLHQHVQRDADELWAAVR